MTDLEVISGEVVEYRTAEEWGVIVRADLGRSVEGVIDAGRHLREARPQLGHGNWDPWLRSELRMTQPTASKLMLISKHEAISNHAHANDLPASWDTLYQLSHLNADLLEKAIADGEVTPALERKAAKALVARYQITDGQPAQTEREATPQGLVATIVADPPWRYGNTSTRAAAQDHYPTMSIDELCEQPTTEGERLKAPAAVAHDRSADDAHLYLWTTAGHLRDAFRVMEAWGFEYKTFLAWVKPQMGMGNYFRVSAELVLFGVRGKLAIEDRSIKNWFEAKRGKHSAKPESFYNLVASASPGPYLEMFTRCRRAEQILCGCARCAHGWEVWGNQT